MADIFLTKEQLGNLKPLSKDNRGAYGICYDYNGQVLKLFNRNIEPSDYYNIKKNLKRKSSVIMYPNSKVYLDDEKTYFKGYLCNKAPGYDLSILRALIKDGKEDVSFDSFLTGYYDNFLPELKKEDILLSDIKLEHIFFNDCFYLIDTDWYKDKPDDMTNQQKNDKNISKFNTYLNNFIFNFIPIEVCSDLTFDINLDERFKEIYIEKIFEGIRNATNGKVDSLNELFNYKFSDGEERESILIL